MMKTNMIKRRKLRDIELSKLRKLLKLKISRYWCIQVSSGIQRGDLAKSISVGEKHIKFVINHLLVGMVAAKLCAFNTQRLKLHIQEITGPECQLIIVVGLIAALNMKKDSVR